MLRRFTAAFAALVLAILSACATAPDTRAPAAEPAATPAADTAATPAPAAPAKKLFEQPYLARELENGLKVFVVKTADKGVVSLQIPISTGSRNEVEAGKTGFAHFFEHMMFRGTPKFPPEAYTAIVTRAGADQNAYTDDDLTNYYMNFTTEDLEKMLEVEADRFQNLSYTEEQFRTEALAVNGEYLKNYSNPLLKGFERLQDLAFTAHTYKHTTMGFKADIEAMPDQMDYAKQFFERWYRPDNASVIIVGDVDPEATFELVKKYFGPWRRGVAQVDVPVEPPQTEAKYEHVAWEGPTLPWIIAGWHGPAFSTTTTDAAAASLLSELYFGETSDLYRQLVVEKQWVNQFFAFAPTNRDPGLFVIAAQLAKPEHAAEVTRAINDTLLVARAHEVPAERIAMTKSRLKYGFAAGMNSAASIGGILARFVHFERDIETLNRYYAVFDAVNAQDIRSVANAIFTDNNRTVVSIAQAPKLDGADGFAPLDAAVAGAASKPNPMIGVAAPAEAPLSYSQQRSRDEYERGAAAWAANEATFSVPRIEVPTESALVDVAMVLDTGAAFDPPGKKGLAALTAAMLFEAGTHDRSYDEIQKALYPFAAPVSVTVDKEMITVSGTVHRDNFMAWWRIVSEQFQRPGFRAEDFARLKQQQLNAVRVGLRGNNDEEFGKEALYELVYGSKHAYGTLTAGHGKDLESITLDDVRAFYLDQFTRGGLRMGIMGGYTEPMREAFLGSSMVLGWTAPAAVDAPVPAVPKQASATVIQKQTSSVAVSFGLPIAVKRGHPDWAALWLARSWLGEHRAFSGRLYQRIREARGMNYGNYAYIEYFPNGMFLMQPEPYYARQNDLFQVWLRPLRSNNDALFATRAALFEIDGLLKRGISEAEFDATRAFLHKQVALLTASQRKQLGYAMDGQYFNTGDFVTYARQTLDQLTAEKVNAALRKHVRLSGMQFVYISKDAQELARMLRQGTPSPISYNTDKPAALLAEDKKIERFPIGVGARVRVVQDNTLFE
jgi:zinc protease